MRLRDWIGEKIADKAWELYGSLVAGLLVSLFASIGEQHWTVVIAIGIIIAQSAFFFATYPRWWLARRREHRQERKQALQEIAKSLTHIRSWASQIRADVLADRMIGNNKRDFGHAAPEIHQAVGVLEGHTSRYFPKSIPLVYALNALLVRFNVLSDHHRLRQEGVPQQDFIASIDAETENIINQCDRLRNYLSL